MLGLGDRPRRLLEAVEGLELVELPGAEECCGFGGTFAVKNPDVSAAMGADKVRNAESTGAEVLCAADNSCLMHIGGTHAPAAARAMRPVHLAEILAEHGGGAGRVMSGTFVGMPALPGGRARARVRQPAALRGNLRHATHTIRAKRATRGRPSSTDWAAAARRRAQQIKDHTLRHLDRYLVQLEEAVTAAGGTVHWAARRRRGQPHRHRAGQGDRRDARSSRSSRWPRRRSASTRPWTPRASAPTRPTSPS